MSDTQTVLAFIAGFAVLAVAAHLLTERYKRFMDAPRDPHVIAAARVFLGYWHTGKAIAAAVLALVVGGLLGGLWGALGCLFAVLVVSALSAASHSRQ